MSLIDEASFFNRRAHPLGAVPGGTMTLQTRIRQVAFVLRCSASASAAYVLALAAGLMHPVWAPMSALIVSQERLADTRASLIGRVLGTVLGMTAAVAVNALAQPWGVDMAWQIAITVALCAPPARRRPSLRVSMWTGPIVLLTTQNPTQVPWVALFRGAEVMLGSLVGALLHVGFDVALGHVLKLLPKGAAEKAKI